MLYPSMHNNCFPKPILCGSLSVVNAVTYTTLLSLLGYSIFLKSSVPKRSYISEGEKQVNTIQTDYIHNSLKVLY